MSDATPEQITAFIERWENSGAAERPISCCSSANCAPCLICRGPVSSGYGGQAPVMQHGFGAGGDLLAPRVRAETAGVEVRRVGHLPGQSTRQSTWSPDPLRPARHSEISGSLGTGPDAGLTADNRVSRTTSSGVPGRWLKRLMNGLSGSHLDRLPHRRGADFPQLGENRMPAGRHDRQGHFRPDRCHDDAGRQEGAASLEAASIKGWLLVNQSDEKIAAMHPLTPFQVWGSLAMTSRRPSSAGGLQG